jgi:hypothetical protein
MCDIRSFFKRKRVQDSESSDESQRRDEMRDRDSTASSGAEHAAPENTAAATTTSTHASAEHSETGVQANVFARNDIADIGIAVGCNITDHQRQTLCDDVWVPTAEYDFKSDASALGLTRKFRLEWLREFQWLAYSRTHRGAFCIPCVLFVKDVIRGLPATLFVSKPFTRYQVFHERAREHAASSRHQECTEKASNLRRSMSTQSDVLMLQDKGQRLQIEKNRQLLAPIVKTVLFCCEHDLSLRGKKLDEGVFRDLLKFRVDAGDTVLATHLDEGTRNRNARYLSPKCQNELIENAAALVTKMVIEKVKSASYYSILADESADIAGIEQLSVGLRFADEEETTGAITIREEFLGFVPLAALDAGSVSDVLLACVAKWGLSEEATMVGQGYDGCSTMSGCVNGVQTRVRNIHPSAIFSHCASHRLNLVVNKASTVSEIRNCVGTIKNVVVFFRESPLRRKLVPNIPLLCETRWTAKYKAIRVFTMNLVAISEALEHLSGDAKTSAATRTSASQLHSTITKPSFIICAVIIFKYSSILEPVTNALQGIAVDLSEVQQHAETLIAMFVDHRNDPATSFEELFHRAEEIAAEVGVDLVAPRVTNVQRHRSNAPASTTKDYYRINVFIPYLDALVSAMRDRFGCVHPAYGLFNLHPSKSGKMSSAQLQESLQPALALFPKLSCLGIGSEAAVWCSKWSKQTFSGDLCDAYLETRAFFPAIREAMKIALSFPSTTCTIERSFSTMRRVKTWLRSTMSHTRLSGLCVLSVHRRLVEKIGRELFVKRVIDDFAKSNPRRLAFIFGEDK